MLLRLIWFSVDIISLLFELIQFLLSKSSNSSIAPDNRNWSREALPDLKRTFAMVDGAGATASTIEPDYRRRLS